MKQTQLDRQFDELNAKLFGGRLPKYRVRKPPPNSGISDGECDDQAETIWMEKIPDARQTLLHEMVHIVAGGHHSARFRDELRKIAAMDEDAAFLLAEEEERAAKGLLVGAWGWCYEDPPATISMAKALLPLAVKLLNLKISPKKADFVKATGKLVGFSRDAAEITWKCAQLIKQYGSKRKARQAVVAEWKKDYAPASPAAP